MPPRKRPTAFDVSFPEETRQFDSGGTESDTSRKRDRDAGADVDIRGAKRRNLDAPPKPTRKYEPRPFEILETRDLLVFGEEPDPPDDGKKRVRVLSHFAFFDASHGNSMISLNALDEDDDHQIQGAGFVVARYDIDEDEGQEDDLYDEGDEPQFIRLSKIGGYDIDYRDMNGPLYIKTDHANYELTFPSKKYRSQYRSFYKLHSILQLVISSAKNNHEREFHDFVKEFQTVEVLGQPLDERDLWEIVPKLRRKLETVQNADQLRESYIIRRLLSNNAPVILRKLDVSKVARAISPPIPDIHYRGNPDLAVLRRENQIPTHVTPYISQLAMGRFKERLKVVGRRPPPEPEPPSDELTLRVQGFLMRVSMRRRIQFRVEQRIRRSHWLKYITIDGVKYTVGDTIVFVAGDDLHSHSRFQSPKLPDPNDVAPSDTLPDYFWFARIVSINGEHENVHVQWFEHSSRTFLEQLGHPQELFLTERCDTVRLNSIIGRVEVHYIEPARSLAAVKPHDFFYRYIWDDDLGLFKDIDTEALASAWNEPPPHNCLVCEIREQFHEDSQAARIGEGVRWHGVNYHVNDFVFIKAKEGPCNIGQISTVNPRDAHGHDNVRLTVRLFGRVDKLGNRPVTTMKDERHLFYTDTEMTFEIGDLIGMCYVLVGSSMPELDAWKAMSPRHFYVKYRFPSLNVESWSDRRRMEPEYLGVCKECMGGNLRSFRDMKTFLGQAAPLRVFDPFGGTGAFGLGLEEVGCFEMTHAVEISPSAARTLRMNASRGIKIYNQCSNLVLRQAILVHENKNPEELKSIEGHTIPPLPKPGEIDCIITGFPWQVSQPHSRLNMYPKANDTKNNLILNVLSWVDFLKPQYCIFENVRGFLQFNLRVRQDGKHGVKGGIPMGGLKFVARALLDMGYQLRCGLLQAAHYGTPQTRVRFFLIAAKRGLELPDLPQPTHDFPVSDSLEIKFPNGTTIQPIRPLSGIAQHRYVSVHDAISDLPVFHWYASWKHPRKNLSPRQMQEQKIKDCLENQPWCGLSGRDVPYEHEPRTGFQAKCRRKVTRDLQHYTRTYDSKKVERQIPLEADADYRTLRPDLWEWQFANPSSSIAKAGFRPGLYGRVQGDGWFQTTVTNVDPTAKQCRVLHPYCKRIVTVRELARSQGFPDHFVFYAINDRVVTMHRQIGNSVPWPVSMAIAQEFRDTRFKQWTKAQENEEGRPS
ncbi:S-adenosyl-L-methionine-dependent methyltransferase [Gyrodon lividus]|nr:S-adenosyl-L-methionine-dependent methyltransferase [Gyrodon lividus]